MCVCVCVCVCVCILYYAHTHTHTSDAVGERRGGFQQLISPLLRQSPGNGGTSTGHGDPRTRVLGARGDEGALDVFDHMTVARVLLEEPLGAGGLGEEGMLWRAVGLEVGVVDSASGVPRSRKRLLLGWLCCNVCSCLLGVCFGGSFLVCSVGCLFCW